MLLPCLSKVLTEVRVEIRVDSNNLFDLNLEPDDSDRCHRRINCTILTEDKDGESGPGVSKNIKNSANRYKPVNGVTGWKIWQVTATAGHKNGGGGGNRTHVRRYANRRYYMLSPSFLVSLSRPPRGGVPGSLSR